MNVSYYAVRKSGATNWMWSKHVDERGKVGKIVRNWRKGWRAFFREVVPVWTDTYVYSELGTRAHVGAVVLFSLALSRRCQCRLRLTPLLTTSQVFIVRAEHPPGDYSKNATEKGFLTIRTKGKRKKGLEETHITDRDETKTGGRAQVCRVTVARLRTDFINVDASAGRLIQKYNKNIRSQFARLLVDGRINDEKIKKIRI